MLIRDIMSSDSAVIPSLATLQDAAQRMRDEDVGMLPVIDGADVVGTITDRDIAMHAVAAGADPLATTVADAMTAGAVRCLEDEDVQVAVDLMKDKQVRRLVVMGAGNRVAGVISVDDIALKGDGAGLAGEVLRAIAPEEHQKLR